MDQSLPRFPTPLYAFPLKDGLEAKFPHGLSVRPINTEQGVAPFRYITVDDAIGDLYRFDWQVILPSYHRNSGLMSRMPGKILGIGLRSREQIHLPPRIFASLPATGHSQYASPSSQLSFAITQLRERGSRNKRVKGKMR